MTKAQLRSGETEGELLAKAAELHREQMAKLWRKLEDLNAAIQFSETARELRQHSCSAPSMGTLASG